MVIGSHHNGSVAELNERFSHHRHLKELVCRVERENLTDLYRSSRLVIRGGSKRSEVFCDVSITPITDIVWKKKNRKVLRW